MNKFKRTLALFLVLCTVMSVAPFSVFAADVAEVPTEQTAASEEATVPTEQTEAPTEEMTVPAEQTEAPTEETVAPTEETAAPTEETVAPTEETTAPTEEDPTEPSDETVPAEEEISPVAITISPKPSDGDTSGQPFAAGTGKSQNFRIPGIVTLADGTLVASCDARWNHTGDGAGLDTIVSSSTNNGANWHYTFANYLGDNGNIKNVYSTSFIDPAIATDGTTAYMIADLFPAGIALNTSKHSPMKGHNGLDDQGRLMLRQNTLNVTSPSYSTQAADANYEYYLENGSIYNKNGTKVEDYTVDAYFNIKGKNVNTNLFCSDSPYQPYPTNYLYLTTSTDGRNWSEPQLLNLKEANEQTLLVGPGNGTYDADSGRLIFTAYDYTDGNQHTLLIWRGTDGVWHRTADATKNSWSSEATAVVLKDGTVRCFYRSGSSKLQYTDYTWNAGQNNYVPSKMEQTFDVARTPNNQMSAIKYSKTLNGQEVLLVATAATTNKDRLDGHIYALAVNPDDNSMKLVNSYDVVPGSRDSYSYSCLTELDNGDIGLLYENGNGTIKYETISIAKITNNAQFDESTKPDQGGDKTLTDKENDVTVTAPNLTNLVVKKLETSTPAEGFDQSVSYEIILNNGEYTGPATVKIPAGELASCTEFVGYVDQDSFEVPAPEGDYFTVNVPHFSTVTISGKTAVTPEPPVKQVEVTVEVGQTKTEILDGNYDTGSNAPKDYADVSWKGTDGVSVTAMAQLGKDKNYNGDKIPLEECLYTFTETGSKYYIESSANKGTYLSLSIKYYPGGTSRKAITVTDNGAGNFVFKGKKYWLRYSESNGYLQANSKNTVNQMNLYQKVEGAGSTELPGYEKVTSIKNGGQYLIVAKIQSEYFLLHPATTKDHFAHTAKVVTENGTVAQTTVTITGKTPGTTSVVVGDTQYNITVTNKKVAVNLPVGGQQVFDCSGTITTQPNATIATAVVADGKLTITGVAEGQTTMTVDNTDYIITVQNKLTLDNTPFIAGTGNGTNYNVSADKKEPDGKITKLTTSVNLTYQLKLDPTVVNGQTVEWSVDDSSIATVDRNGKVTGVSKGETRVNATINGVTYSIPVAIVDFQTKKDPGDWKIYDFYTAEIANTTVWYVWNCQQDADKQFHELQEGEAIYVAYDKDQNNACDFFAKPDEGYALTRMMAPGSHGHYFKLHTGNHATVDKGPEGFIAGKTEKGTAAGINQSQIWGDRAVVDMVQNAVDMGCDGGMGFTRKETDHNNVNFTLSFRSEKLPTITKEVKGILGTDNQYRPYKPGMTAQEGETVYYEIVVTKYACQDLINYSKVLVNDHMEGNKTVTFFEHINTPLENPADITTTINKDKLNPGEHVYYASHVITTDDLDQTLVNHADLTYNYRSDYSSGEYGGSAEAAASITATAFKPQDIVIDFGLPVTVHYDQWGKNVQLQPKGKAKYGEVAVATTDGGWDVTYTPAQILQGVDTVTLTAVDSVTKAATEYTFNVYPATTVYYEEGFANLNGFSGGSKGNAQQQTQLAGEANKNAFGYDDAYNAVGMSNGTEIISNKVNNTTDFTFTGTGIEIYANCATNTGIASITIRDAQTSVLHKFYQVDTRTKKGTTGATEQQEMESNSLPIVSVRDLPWGKYKVTIIHTQRSADGLGGNIRLDGYRVFNTLNDPELENAAYPESEKNPHYEELRDWVLNALKVDDTTDSIYNEAGSIIDQVYNANGTTNGAVVLAPDGVYTQDNMKDLLDNGPKNELFLYPNQAVTFNLTANNAQIGLKAVNGTVSYKLNQENKTINTSTDMFYHNLSKGSVTIQNTSSQNVLSITLLKCFGASASVFGEITQDQMADALRTLGCEEPIVRADASLKVSLVDNTGAEVASTVLTANGIAGEVNSFTAEQILAAAREQMPVKYAFADEQSVKGAEVVFGEEGTVTVKVGKTATLNVTYVKRELKRVGFFRFKMVETVVETKSFTGVKTSAGRYYRVSAKQIRDAAPDGTFVLSGATSKRVPFGSEVNMKVIVK